MDPYNVIARQYQYDLGRGLNFVSYSLETIMHNMALVSQVGAPLHFTYIQNWEECWAEQGGGFGTIRAQDDKE